jgi:hypothetical protein
MNRIIAALLTLFASATAFAETGEVPMETAGTGGIIAFFVICIALAVAFVWMTNKNSKKSQEERSGDKLK